MSKRIFWKKGMRLTEEILTASDQCTDHIIGHVLTLASAGQFGLIPSSAPFQLNVNPIDGILHIEALSCLAVTRSGDLIDVAYDTRYTNTFDTRVTIPEANEGAQLLLTIQPLAGERRETNDNYGETVYQFALTSPDSPIADNAMPIARVVNQYGWHIDEEDFVPPCLLLKAHPKYEEAYQRFLQLLREMEQKACGLTTTKTRTAMRIIWPHLQQLLIETDKERDVATPMSLLEKIQRCVSAFYCACELDDYLDLADADTFRAYALAPYNYKDAYPRIREGIQMCLSISEKFDKMKEAPQAAPTPMTPPPPPQTIAAPVIPDRDRRIGCADVAHVHVSCADTAATLYFSTDGSAPQRAIRGGIITLNTGYSRQRLPEPERNITLKVVARKGTASSEIVTYQIVLFKDFNKFSGREI